MRISDWSSDVCSSDLLLWALRGYLAAGLAVSLAIGSAAASAGLQFSPSRAVTFRSLSLLVIGSYLLLMVVVTQSLALVGGDLARLSQVGFFRSEESGVGTECVSMCRSRRGQSH